MIIEDTIYIHHSNFQNTAQWTDSWGNATLEDFVRANASILVEEHLAAYFETTLALLDEFDTKRTKQQLQLNTLLEKIQLQMETYETTAQIDQAFVRWSLFEVNYFMHIVATSRHSSA